MWMESLSARGNCRVACWQRSTVTHERWLGFPLRQHHNGLIIGIARVASGVLRLSSGRGACVDGAVSLQHFDILPAREIEAPAKGRQRGKSMVAFVCLGAEGRGRRGTELLAETEGKVL